MSRYIVAFRSTRAKDSPSKDLYEADRLAHEEAVSVSTPPHCSRHESLIRFFFSPPQRGGLLLYWYGSPTALGSNLATCIWQSRKHAVLANSGPRHLEAIRLARVSSSPPNLSPIPCSLFVSCRKCTRFIHWNAMF